MKEKSRGDEKFSQRNQRYNKKDQDQTKVRKRLKVEEVNRKGIISK